MRSAELRNLLLAGSSLPGLSADRLEATGGVYLRNGFEATGEVRLPGAKLGGNLELPTARSSGRRRTGKGLKGWALNLDGVRVDGALFLRNEATVDGVIDLTAAQIGHLNDAESSWPEPGLLAVNRFQYGAITGGPVDATRRLDWLGRQDPARWGADFWPQPYEQLAKVLREMGHGDEAKTVLIAKERLRREVELGRLPGWRRPFYWGFTQLLRMVGYGYRPAMALIPAALVVLLGWAVVHSSTRTGLLVPAARAQAGAPARVLVPLAYSIEAFVPIVKLGQVEAFRPDLGTRWGFWLQVYLWVHGFLGWLIGGIAAAGVLGLFRRE